VKSLLELYGHSAILASGKPALGDYPPRELYGLAAETARHRRHIFGHLLSPFPDKNKPAVRLAQAFHEGSFVSPVVGVAVRTPDVTA
jgi:hypothetical protein